MTATATLGRATSNGESLPAPIVWQSNTRIPRYCAAVLDALKFTTVAPSLPVALREDEWRQALRFCDEARITLLVAKALGDALPAWVAERTARNLRDNRERLEGLQREYLQIANRLAASSVEHVVLKGFGHGSSFGPDASYRPQYDLDLWCREQDIIAAREAVAGLGFESVVAHERFPTIHLAPMIRKTGWDWRGDYFDPRMPPVVELHFGLWDERIERFDAPGLDEFWGRRRQAQRAGIALPVMCEADQFGFAALHALRHLLRGDLRALHVYEIAHFLHLRRDDAPFWDEWQRWHPPGLRKLEGIASALARKWFACGVPSAMEAEIHALPADVTTWLENYAACAVESKFSSSKDELWLHMSLLSSLTAKAAVMRRRMLPLSLPGRVESEFVAEHSRTLRGRLRGAAQYAVLLGSRALHHLRSWAAMLSSGVLWWRLRRRSRRVSGAPGPVLDGD